MFAGEYGISDPNFESALPPREPAISFSAERASITYPDGKVFWFKRSGTNVALDKEKSYDTKGTPLRAEDILKARSAVIEHLTSLT